jgi:hypothetical protein
MVTMAVLCRGKFALADGAVAVAIELAEQGIGARCVDAVGSECAFEFRLADLPVTIGVELRQQSGRRTRVGVGLLVL